MPQPVPPGPVTRLLSEASGDDDLVERLVPLVYDELRRSARQYLRRDSDATLQTTELVHEAYAKLAAGSPPENRAHFFGAASRAMRQVLVDRARKRNAAKRPQNRVTVEFGRLPATADEQADEVLAVHEALERFAQLDPRAARVVECRFFGGLSVAETAEALDIAPRTVARDWTDARAWLHRELHAAE